MKQHGRADGASTCFPWAEPLRISISLSRIVALGMSAHVKRGLDANRHPARQFSTLPRSATAGLPLCVRGVHTSCCAARTSLAEPAPVCPWDQETLHQGDEGLEPVARPSSASLPTVGRPRHWHETCDELVGEHGFSFGIKSRREGAHDFRQSSAVPQKGACVGSNFRGVSRLPHHDIPRPCRDTGPPHKAGFVFSGARIAPSARNCASAKLADLPRRVQRRGPTCGDRVSPCPQSWRP